MYHNEKRGDNWIQEGSGQKEYRIGQQAILLEGIKRNWFGDRKKSLVFDTMSLE